jgi:uncharacterized protein DUF6492
VQLQIITPSYQLDFERCRLMCETMDRYISSDFRHLIIVDCIDYRLFKPLAGTRREIIQKEDVLPRWVWSMGLTMGRLRRRIWLSLKSRPIGGWLMQQIAKLALAQSAISEHLLIVDSDVCFVRDFNIDRILRNDRLPLYRRPDAIIQDTGHAQWCETAGKLLSINARFPAPDYIAQMITWRSSNARALCGRIEKVTGRNWIAAIANAHRFSEYIAYGMFADLCLGSAGHYHSETPLCHSYWEYTPLSSVEDVMALIDHVSQDQVAVGIQSISGTPPNLIRAALHARQ